MQSKLEELITNGETKFLKEEKTLYELQSQISHYKYIGITNEAQEGKHAFLEKRDPDFQQFPKFP
jgi:1,4-dihydroxy-2-naphthoyl-CoA synthase